MQRFTINAALTKSPSELALNTSGLQQEVLDEVVKQTSNLSLRLEGDILYLTVLNPPNGAADLKDIMFLQTTYMLAEQALAAAKKESAMSEHEKMLRDIAKKTGLDID